MSHRERLIAEIAYARQFVGVPSCSRCGQVHDDRVTRGRGDSCYRELRPAWMCYVTDDSVAVIRLLLAGASA